MHPAEKRLAISCDGVPGRIEGVIALVIAMGIGRTCAARDLDDSADRPMWQDGGVRTGNAQIIDDLLYRHDCACCRERGLLLHPDDPLDQYIPCAICP